jgi:hypothetical protein
MFCGEIDNIYMPLLNEGTYVFRPIIARKIDNNDLYQVLGTRDGLSPEELDEEWLFPIGSIVTTKMHLCEKENIEIVDKLAE